MNNQSNITSCLNFKGYRLVYKSKYFFIRYFQNAINQHDIPARNHPTRSLKSPDLDAFLQSQPSTMKLSDQTAAMVYAPDPVCCICSVAGAVFPRRVWRSDTSADETRPGWPPELRYRLDYDLEPPFWSWNSLCVEPVVQWNSSIDNTYNWWIVKNNLPRL